jgi:hypothetical protein
MIYNIGGWEVSENDELLIFLVDFHLRRKSLVRFLSPSYITTQIDSMSDHWGMDLGLNCVETSSVIIKEENIRHSFQHV